MRVIAGKAKGRNLIAPEGMDTRPITDAIKEALFSMLFGRTQDAVGLDLFAGSGALGIELLSRYGKECTFVDMSRAAIDVVSKNITKAHLEDRAFVECRSAQSFLHSVSKKFDIIFIDPPYASGLYGEVLDIISERELLCPEGVIVCECNADLELRHRGFDIIKDKTYGKVRLYVLEEA